MRNLLILNLIVIILVLSAACKKNKPEVKVFGRDKFDYKLNNQYFFYGHRDGYVDTVMHKISAINYLKDDSIEYIITKEFKLEGEFIFVRDTDFIYLSNTNYKYLDIKREVMFDIPLPIINKKKWQGISDTDKYEVVSIGKYEQLKFYKEMVYITRRNYGYPNLIVGNISFYDKKGFYEIFIEKYYNHSVQKKISYIQYDAKTY